VYDVFKIKETERIIRAQNCQHSHNYGEIHFSSSWFSRCFIRVLDTWSSIQVFYLKYENRNWRPKFFCYGHQLDYQFTNRLKKRKWHCLFYQISKYLSGRLYNMQYEVTIMVCTKDTDNGHCYLEGWTK
jgi:hypothetical protein